MAHTKRAPVDPGSALKRTPRRSAGESTQVPSFDVVLRDVGTGDLNVVKLVQQATGGSLQEARDIVAGDGVVIADVSRAEADAVAGRLERAGVGVEVRLHGAAAPWQGPAAAAGGFDVVLRAVGTEDLNVVKRVQQATGVSLQEARDIVAGDGVVKADVSREEAEAVARRLESAGVAAEVRLHGAEAPWQGPAAAAGGFDVVLRAVGTGDLNVVKRVQQAMGVSLQEARDIVVGDGVVKTDVSREEAAAVAGRLASAGVEVEVRAHAGG